PTGFQPLVDLSIELGRRRALRLHQLGVQIVVEQVQPQYIRGLRRLRHRYEVRRNGFDILSARFFCKRPHAADWIIFEVGNFSRHEAVNPAFRSHDLGEETGPVAVARVNVDDGGARIDSCELDQLRLLGLVVHRDLLNGWAFDERVACEGRSTADTPSALTRWPQMASATPARKR